MMLALLLLGNLGGIVFGAVDGNWFVTAFCGITLGLLGSEAIDRVLDWWYDA